MCCARIDKRGPGANIDRERRRFLHFRLRSPNIMFLFRFSIFTQTHAKIWIFFCYSRLEMRCWKFSIKKFNRRMESLRVLSGTWNNNLTYFEKWNIRNSSFLKVCSIERMEFKKLYFEIFRKTRKKCWTGYLKGDEVIKSFVRKIRYDNNWIQLF